MEQLEIERRYLIEIPLKWYGKFVVLNSDRSRIYQTYLKSFHDRTTQRIRAVAVGDKTEYFYTTKTPISTGVNREAEWKIRQDEYKTYVSREDKLKMRITKTRYNLPKFFGRHFTLDVFEDILLGLAILEVELKQDETIETDVILPPYLKVMREITGFDQFSNYKLADIVSQTEMKKLIESVIVK